MITLTITHIVSIVIALLGFGYGLVKIILYFYKSDLDKVKEQIVDLLEACSSYITYEHYDVQHSKVLEKLEDSEKEIYEVIRQDRAEINKLLMNIHGSVERIKGQLDKLT